MRPNNFMMFTSCGRRRGAARRCAALAVWLTASPMVWGHNVMVSRGQFVVNAQHVDVQLEVAAEDMLHWYDLSPGPAGKISIPALREAAEEFALQLGEVLVIRAADGRRLPVECRPPQLAWPATGETDLAAITGWSATFRLRYVIGGAPDLLILQIRAGAMPVETPWQVVLSARGAFAGDGPVLRLTSRGNAELVELSWKDSRPRIELAGSLRDVTACAGLGVRRFQEICVEANIGESHVDATVVIPLALLNTWFSVPAGPDGLLHELQQRQVIEAAGELMGRSLAVSLDGRAAEAELRSVEIDAAASQAGEISLWSSCVRASIRFAGPRRFEQVSFSWRLFNAAVLSARFIPCARGVCIPHELSTYRPTVKWQRPPHRVE